MRSIGLLLFIFLFSDACVERYDVPSQITATRLVVDGMITDLPGPYTVKLSTSASVNTTTAELSPVQSAIVVIGDDTGYEEQLEETSPGVYQTHLDGIQGELGRKYYVKIKTGVRQYESQPQELASPGFISKLYYVYRENVINQSALELAMDVPHDVIDIYIDGEGFEDQENLFRWRWSSIYEIKTFPRYRAYIDDRTRALVPDPPPCSGFRLRPKSKTLIEQFGPCTCCDCWTYEDSEQVLLSDNEFVNEANFKGVHVARLPVDHWRFNVKYYMKVEQLSLSEEVYQFWKTLKAQQDGEGSLFVPNAVRIKGNIHSVTDPKEEVLGIFGVSTVAWRDFYITPDDLPKPVSVDTLKDDCALARFRSTNVKPPFW
jgi:hypothetical protein